MSGLNKVLLIGHVGAKPEIKRSQSGEAIAHLRVATSSTRQREGSEQKDTEWHDVVAFGKLAEVCESYVEKGRLVYIEGRMSSHTWQDKTGNKRLEREVIARRLDLLGPRPTAAA
jgi:single-strand DNA-binding protein